MPVVKYVGIDKSIDTSISQGSALGSASSRAAMSLLGPLTLIPRTPLASASLG